MENPNYIWLVDDSRIDLFIAHKLLSKWFPNSHLQSWQNPSVALEEIPEQIREIPVGEKILLLLDINMPGMNGYELAEEITKLKLDSRLCVCMLSSSIDSRDENRVKDYACIKGFINKPLSLEKLQSLALEVVK